MEYGPKESRTETTASLYECIGNLQETVKDPGLLNRLTYLILAESIARTLPGNDQAQDLLRRTEDVVINYLEDREQELQTP